MLHVVEGGLKLTVGVPCRAGCACERHTNLLLLPVRGPAGHMPRIEFATVVDAAGETAISTDFEENVLFTTAERMKKPFASIGFAGAIALLVAGCTAGTEPAPVAAPAPVVAAPVVETCSTEDLGPWGDVVAYKDVTDEFGTYCQTTIDPAAEVLQYDVSKVDLESLKEYGFTEQDVKDGLVKGAEFLSQEVLDSTVMDKVVS
jgi:hypothetical protein